GWEGSGRGESWQAVLPGRHLPFARPFFFNGAPPPAVYTLSLHDALPISQRIFELRAIEGALARIDARPDAALADLFQHAQERRLDRKSTRLNSSHDQSSYAVFCLKNKRRA